MNPRKTLHSSFSLIPSHHNLGKYNIPELKPYQQIHTELSVSHGIIVRGHRIVIPKSLRERVLSLAHTGHQGIAKNKQLLRTKVWWPGIDKDVESLVKSCVPCQATTRPTNPSPLKMTTLPERPCSSLYMDFCGPFPNGESALVVIYGFQGLMKVNS